MQAKLVMNPETDRTDEDEAGMYFDMSIQTYLHSCLG